ncbi:hypothetical protein [Brevundimonas poindexterae]|uniref:hypothetical protein n=1 Tax=Brevundimonas poindexterae TaxID=74325 RepID=UPI001CFDBA60|nr:hypothetical protein [Brevundimonas poindexterae]
MVTAILLTGLLSTAAVQSPQDSQRTALTCIAALEYPGAFVDGEPGVTEAAKAWRGILAMSEPDATRQARMVAYYREGLDFVGSVDRRLSIQRAQRDVEEHRCLSVERESSQPSETLGNMTVGA